MAKALGLSSETIRHYREFGLLHPTSQENGYFTYHTDDILSALLVRELRSQELSLSTIKETLTNRTMDDYCQMLNRRQAELEQQMNLIQLLQDRLRETQVYASCGVRILNGVEEFDGPATWAVGVLDREELSQESYLSQWVECFPFTYVSATITLDQLDRRMGQEPYHIAIGSGALEKYVERFHLPLPEERSFFQSGGHFIRTCIAVEDVLSICPDHIRHLLLYADEHGYRFASHTGGRLLFIENGKEKPLYYILIWVRVDPI